MLIPDDFFAPSTCQRVIKELDTAGTAAVPAVIGAETLREPRFAADVDELYACAYAGAQRNSLCPPDLAHVPQNVVNQIWRSEAIHQLAREILQACVGNEKCDAHFVINALDSRAAVADYGVGHFDACYLTLLLPLRVVKPPDVGEAGKLRVWPNARRFTQSRAWDSLGCRLFSFRSLRERMPSVHLDLQPGWLYAFYGFRSFHQVVPIVEGIQRVTMLMHFGGPRFDRINGVKRKYR